MGAAKEIEIVNPGVYSECEGCPFLQRAIEQARWWFGHHAKKITMTCEVPLLHGGGLRQVKPGKWVEYQNRTITGVPCPTSPNVQEEIVQGTIITCPHDIPEAAEEHKYTPEMTKHYTEPYGRRLSSKRRPEK